MKKILYTICFFVLLSLLTVSLIDNTHAQNNQNLKPYFRYEGKYDDVVSYSTFSPGYSYFEQFIRDSKGSLDEYEIPTREDWILRLEFPSDQYIENGQIKSREIDSIKIKKIEVIIEDRTYSTFPDTVNISPLVTIRYRRGNDSLFYNYPIQDLKMEVAPSDIVTIYIQPETKKFFPGGVTKIYYSDGTYSVSEIGKGYATEFIKNTSATLLDSNSDFVGVNSLSPGVGKNNQKNDWHFVIKGEVPYDESDYENPVSIKAISITDSNPYTLSNVKNNSQKNDSSCYTDRRAGVANDNKYPVLVKYDNYKMPVNSSDNLNLKIPKGNFEIHLYCQSDKEVLDIMSNKLKIGIYVKEIYYQGRGEYSSFEDLYVIPVSSIQLDQANTKDKLVRVDKWNGPVSAQSGTTFSYKLNFFGGPTIQEQKAFVHFVGSDGIVKWKSDITTVIPTNKWKDGLNIVDVSVTVPKDIPAGTYKVMAGLYSLNKAIVLNEGLGVTKDSLNRYQVGTITISKPIEQPKITILPISNQLSVESGKLLNYSVNFVASSPTIKDQRVYVHFLDEFGVMKWKSDVVPLTPTTKWSGSVSVPISVLVPSGMRPIEYTVIAGLYEAGTVSGLPLNPGSGVTQEGVGRYKIGKVKVITPTTVTQPVAPTTQPLSISNVNLYSNGQILGSPISVKKNNEYKITWDASNVVSGTKFYVNVESPYDSRQIYSSIATNGSLGSNIRSIYWSVPSSFADNSQVRIAVHSDNTVGYSSTINVVSGTVSTPIINNPTTPVVNTPSTPVVNNKQLQSVTPSSGKAGTTVTVKIVGASSAFDAGDFYFGQYTPAPETFRIIDSQNVSFVVPNNIPTGTYEIGWFGATDSSTLNFTVTAPTSMNNQFMASVVNIISKIPPFSLLQFLNPLP